MWLHLHEEGAGMGQEVPGTSARLLRRIVVHGSQGESTVLFALLLDPNTRPAGIMAPAEPRLAIYTGTNADPLVNQSLSCN